MKVLSRWLSKQDVFSLTVLLRMPCVVWGEILETVSHSLNRLWMAALYQTLYKTMDTKSKTILLPVHFYNSFNYIWIIINLHFLIFILFNVSKIPIPLIHKTHWMFYIILSCVSDVNKNFPTLPCALFSSLPSPVLSMSVLSVAYGQLLSKQRESKCLQIHNS